MSQLDIKDTCFILMSKANQHDITNVEDYGNISGGVNKYDQPSLFARDPGFSWDADHPGQTRLLVTTDKVD